MTGARQTLTLQRNAILAASLIGLACCLAAVLDARSQQADERTLLPPDTSTQAAGHEFHRMRGWLAHRFHEAAPAQRVQADARSLG